MSVATFEREEFGLGLEGDGSVGSRADQAVEDAAVDHGDDRHTEVGRDGGAGIDDVFEQVIEVRAAGAGEVRADVGALAVEPVADGARLREDSAAGALVGSMSIPTNVTGTRS